MDIGKQSLKELIHIRCLLEGLCVSKGVVLNSVKERATDEFNELFSKEEDT